MLSETHMVNAVYVFICAAGDDGHQHHDLDHDDDDEVMCIIYIQNASKELDFQISRFLSKISGMFFICSFV